MSRRKTIRILRLFILCGLMLIPAVYLWHRQRFFMPAPLRERHGYLKDDCSHCHKMNKGVDEDLCADCHELPKDRASFEGFAKHHKYDGDPEDEPNLDCFECHTGDHPEAERGKQATSTKVDKGFKDIPCGKCHEKLLGKDYTYSCEGEGRTRPASHLKPSMHRKHERWRFDCKVCHGLKLVAGEEKPDWKCADCHRSWLFSAHDFKKPGSLLAKLRTARGSLSRYLWEQFSISGKRRLDKYDGSGLDSEWLKTLASELNSVIKGPPLYDPRRFDQIQLSKRVRALIEEGPQDEALIRLNRWLLEAAYTKEMAESGRPFKGLARHHTYADLACVECHTEHQGEDASLLRDGADRRLSNCVECHEQDMGGGYTYELAEGPLRFDHAAPSIHKKHEKWKSDCKNCHDRGILIYRCTNCHDPDTNAPHTFSGFAKHHAYTGLKCLECHTEHKGDGGPTTTVEIDFTKIDCAQCHAREMGSQYEYTMLTTEHPQDSIHEAHQKWADDCGNCHDRGTPNEKCVNCHDPTSGEKHVFEKVAQHHTDSRLDCLECHTEHRGRSPESLTRQGKDFGRINCSECHYGAEMDQNINISDLSKSLIGDATVFSHKQHPISDNVRDCELCHEHRKKGTHVFEKYSLSCTGCHHVDQKIPCEKCHTETDRFYRGIVPDTLLAGHPDRMSKVVKCEQCHVFDKTRRTFDKVRDKCVACHTADYGNLADYWKLHLKSEVDELHNELAKMKASGTYADYIASIEKNLDLVKAQGMHNWEVSIVLIRKLRIQIRSLVK